MSSVWILAMLFHCGSTTSFVQFDRPFKFELYQIVDLVQNVKTCRVIDYTITAGKK